MTKYFLWVLLLGSNAFAHLNELSLPDQGLERLQTSLVSVSWQDGISYTVEIEAPIAKTWEYMSSSDNAKDWSVFFSHISADPSSASDGSPGSLRRCFRDKTEALLWWDETVLKVIPFRERDIYTYHLKGFWPQVFTKNSSFYVRQTYQEIGSQKTALTFSTVADAQNPWVNRLLFQLGKAEGLDIFKKNLENIKDQIEGRPRRHPYESFPRNFLEKVFSN